MSIFHLGEKKYLEAILNQLELMIAYYSYGNGEIMIEDSMDWIDLDFKATLSKINKMLKAELGLQVSNMDNTFSTTLWFEMKKK
ncbi:hypothetical protein C7H19_15425 [Aphanothece hegewaldii CCALA 016]|uniref:Uncharacterized protein n=1 Tax=Aphanothece hegewaldii CCALA 016 TaxID=2107694 RepID=A0A2T1LVR6_9CHRO|nr:hypothetical protein [Aphanothece hegewaldii]PSF35814.1 hypothetical protein C7H19_15425 [Aphanothece hegewaldii CCALA 016]